MALAAALLLVLQTVATAFASGAGGVPRDIFGNPLCITSGDHAGQHGPDGPAHDGPGGCCAMACGYAAAVAPTPDPWVLAAPLASAPVAVITPRLVPAARLLERSPLNARAPPLLS